jgi:SHS2 domain-containing protein
MGNYEIFATTADMGIRFKGRNFAELYENALRGLNLLLFGRNPRASLGTGSVPFRFRGDGPESVLVNLLAEVLFLVYQKRKKVIAIDFSRAERNSLDARLRLVSCILPPKADIKSVTYHNLRVVEKKGMIRAAVVFDV